MVRVAPINLTFNPRTLWFDPGDLTIDKDMPVVVRTARGTEFGRAASDIIEVSEDQIKALHTPLRPVERIATPEDEDMAKEMEERSRNALPVFREMAQETNEDMHPVSVEFLLDGDKAIFYFEAEERVDFRDLVRKLAAHFHVRIDMRQIGVRDEARMVGGLGHCGQELCCKRLGGEFCPVSIRMAKEQGLSLNPQKISGLCGRLMCCLRYEYEAYKEFRSRAPKVNATIQTPDGPAKVTDLDVPLEIVSVKVEGEKPVRVPLADFDPPEEGSRPSVIGEEAWKKANTKDDFVASESVVFATSQFTGADKLAEGGKIRRTGTKAKGEGSAEGNRKNRSSERSRSRKHDAAASSEAEHAQRRRRRSTKLAASEDGHALKRVSTSRGESAASTEAASSQNTRGKAGKERREESSSKNRSRRSRSRGAAKDRTSTEQASSSASTESKKIRPGQRSSGLSKRGEVSSKASSRGAQPSQNGAAADKKDASDRTASNAPSQRKPRRRSRRPKSGDKPGKQEKGSQE